MNGDKGGRNSSPSKEEGRGRLDMVGSSWAGGGGLWISDCCWRNRGEIAIMVSEDESNIQEPGRGVVYDGIEDVEKVGWSRSCGVDARSSSHDVS